MKIAHVVSTFPPYKGGIGNVAFNQCTSLANLGHRVIILTPDYGRINQQQNNQFSFKVIRVKPLLKYGNAALVPTILRYCKDYDIIQLHYPFLGLHEFINLNKYVDKEKFVIYYHMDLVGRGLPRLLFKVDNYIFRKKILNFAKKIFSSSIDYISHSSIKDYYYSHKEKFEEVPIGVNPSVFKELGPQLELRKMLNISINEKILLFVGGLDKTHYFKGIDILLKAIEPIDNLKLIIAGEGNLKGYYQETAQRLKIDSKVIFVGNISDSDLVRYYNLCDVFVLPSIDKSEAFGLVLLEAMACGKPVIASDLPGVRTVIRDEIDGLLVRPADVDDLVEKINYLLDNENKIKEYGKNGRIRIQKQYSWREIMQKLEGIYNDII